jgi:hypothetical protein
MTEKFAKISVGIIIAVMLMSALLVFMPKDASAQYEYGVTIEISGDKEKTVDVRPGYPGTQYLDFTVTNTGSVNSWERVELTSTVQAGWQSAPSPSIMVLNQGESKSCTVFVSANRNEIAPMQTIVELRGDATTGSSGPQKEEASGTASGTLSIEQYSLIMFDADTPYEKIGPGKESIFTFRVQNIGNGQDQLKFDIANVDDLEDDDWTVVRPDDIVIQPGRKETIRLSVRTPKGFWKDEVHTIQLVAKSKINAKYTEDSFITLWVRGVYVPGFDPMFTIIAIGMIAVIVGKKKYP